MKVAAGKFRVDGISNIAVKVLNEAILAGRSREYLVVKGLEDVLDFWIVI
jgi:hypothetical protein